MLLAVDDLAVEYAGLPAPLRAVDGVSLSVERGRALALVGASGSGKTTTALALLSLLPPGAQVVRGAVRFEGRDLVHLDEAARSTLRGSRMAMVFQDAGGALHPMLSVGEQVGEPLRIHRGAGRREARAEAVRLLTRVGIGDAAGCADRFPHQLSGGMRQRALLAMAIACEPALLVADEPTGALDVTVQASILDLLDELRAERGMAVLHVTHDLALAAERSDEVAVMYAGQLVERGPVAALFSRPAHPYTAALLRALPGNGDGAAPTAAAAGGCSRSPGGGPPETERPATTGCRFRHRCPEARPRCAEESPGVTALDAARDVRCHFPLVA